MDYLKLPIETLKVGSTGTLHALGLAREKGARFLLAFTSEAYGDPQVHPQREDYWGQPGGSRGVYDEAERYAEALTMAYRHTHGVDTAIVRIFNTFGPGMRPDDGRAIATLIWQALNGRPITVAGDGSQTRSVCYVDDLIEGLVRLLRSDLAGPVNIGNPEELSVRQLAEEIRLLCSADVDIVHVPRPEDDPTVRQPRPSGPAERRPPDHARPRVGAGGAGRAGAPSRMADTGPRGGVRRRVPEGGVALTFDDGPQPGSTDRVLDVLAELGVRASLQSKSRLIPGSAGRPLPRRSATRHGPGSTAGWPLRCSAAATGGVLPWPSGVRRPAAPGPLLRSPASMTVPSSGWALARRLSGGASPATRPRRGWGSC